MGPLDLGDGLFFSISVLTATYFIEHKESITYNVALKLMIIVCHLFPLIWCVIEINRHFCENYCCSCVIGERG